MIVVEGQHGVGVQEVPGWSDNNWDRVAYAWLRDSPPGGVLELDITELNFFQTATTMFQLNALRHRHPIVNGYSGWSTQLQELLGVRESPLREPGDCRRSCVVSGGRASVTCCFMRRRSSMRRCRSGSSRRCRPPAIEIVEAHEWPGTWAWRLKDIDPVLRRPRV